MALPQSWMPADMLSEEKDYFASMYPDDFHAAAAAAWESWAAQVSESDSAAVQSVSTGAQSITYAKATSRLSEATDRANWHRARAKARSVAVGPLYSLAGHLTDDYDGGTIATVDVGTL